MGPTGRRVTVEGVEFVEVSPGYFRMGSHFTCEEGGTWGRICALLGVSGGRQPRHEWNIWRGEGGPGECPLAWVEFEHGFWIAKTEVTNAQYERFDPTHRRIGRMEKDRPGDRDAVVHVSWENAVRYCQWMSRSGLPVRLPSESEWECACRAGSEAEYAFGDDPVLLGEYAWFAGNSGYRIREVATRKANAWGLHDPHGNAGEWCEGLFRHTPDPPRDGTPWFGPIGGLQNTGLRPVRGGVYGPAEKPERCRAAFRAATGQGPDSAWWSVGFRPAFTIRTEGEREALRRLLEP
jgi:formylglycine-generating enzyme required for sulfatase activity